MRKRDELLHPGERTAQERFAGPDAWPEAALNQMFRERINAPIAEFLEARPFFFIASADADGNCDASFRSTEPDPEGRPQPAVRVLDERTLVFPDFSGNNLFNSLGNLLVNPRIGMLFIDFENALRVRVNGAAEVVEDPGAYSDTWPTAQRFVRVTPEQVFGNCSKRIPRLVPAEARQIKEETP
ncbi:pyridoxamine 5'-phosphate oxidase family protein [Thiohalorhabdus denitrificans]|uniref:Pyridoxamine 5'-phosphate oxidase N-terminal domain-containing protein n=1 Tax=Thiohalorhabdus denitrificans TaxID=381306 RepID=A0A1G5FAN8_9GAMM|nr:pyridoxamine 5'-phosphate oxidase family protein [Thiohalorhabdus denitrificans]SCY36257.1 hypothetical protein SAMN05661077_1881 [Thiohalorhabdus denitrificans]